MMNFWKYEYVKDNIVLRNQNISNEYNYVKNQFSDNISSTIVYVEDDELYGYVSVNNKNEIWRNFSKIYYQKRRNWLCINRAVQKVIQELKSFYTI